MKNPKITVTVHGSTYTPPVKEHWHPVVCPECYSIATEDLNRNGYEHKQHYMFYTYYPYETRICRECGCRYYGQTARRRIAIYKGAKWLIAAVLITGLWALAYYIFGWNIMTGLASPVVVLVDAFILAAWAAYNGLDWP